MLSYLSFWLSSVIIPRYLFVTSLHSCPDDPLSLRLPKAPAEPSPLHLRLLMGSLTPWVPLCFCHTC